MTPDYGRLLNAELGASIRVEFTTARRAVTNYSVVLVVGEAGLPQTGRVYDGAHGVNELHRYTPAAAASKQRRSSTPVLLVTE
jgi:L-aminopeptidase/D-esterase-like protein